MFKYICINRFIGFTGAIFLLVVFLAGASVCQTKTNLEVFYALNDSLVQRIVKELPGEQKKILLNLNLGESYSLFSNHLKNGFIKSGFEVLSKPIEELNIPQVNIVIEEAGVEYGEVERDGWFGDYYTTRTIEIKGNYMQTFSEKGLEEFNISKKDTVKVSDIEKLENESFPFTQGNIPAEPFLSSIWEPVIAIGIAAVTVFLFFTVRSK